MINLGIESKKYFSTQFYIENAYVFFTVDESFFINPYTYTPIFHNHKKHEFFFVKQGEAVIKAEENNYCLNSGDFILIPEGVNHNVINASENAQIYPVKIKYYKNQRKNSETYTDVFNLLNELICYENAPHIFRECDEIIGEIDILLKAFQNIQHWEYREYCDTVSKMFFINVINHIQNAYKTKNPADKSKKIILPPNDNDNIMNERNIELYTDIIEGYFNTFYNREISLSELARLLRVSERHTIRLLNDIYGMNFAELSMHTRIKMAKRLIIETSLPLNDELANYAGYHSYKGLSRAFKNITGMSPVEFRKQN